MAPTLRLSQRTAPPRQGPLCQGPPLQGPLRQGPPRQGSCASRLRGSGVNPAIPAITTAPTTAPGTVPAITTASDTHHGAIPNHLKVKVLGIKASATAYSTINNYSESRGHAALQRSTALWPSDQGTSATVLTGLSRDQRYQGASVTRRPCASVSKEASGLTGRALSPRGPGQKYVS